jgi:hypothetical protein
MVQASRQREIDCLLRGERTSKMSIEGHWKRWGSVEGGGASLLDTFRCFGVGKGLHGRELRAPR